MAGFRGNRISIVDLFPSMSAWSKRERKTNTIIAVNCLYKGRGSKTNT